MGQRRQGRIVALQILYELDSQDSFVDLEPTLERHFAHVDRAASPDVRQHAEALCRGVVGQLDELDRSIERASKNWRMARMSRVDRNVLRLASYELICCPDVPASVAINEAVEIGRQFGAEDSAGFINGVLGRLAEQQPDRDR